MKNTLQKAGVQYNDQQTLASDFSTSIVLTALNKTE